MLRMGCPTLLAARSPLSGYLGAGMKRVQFERAYLLSLRPYRETSALLEVFSAVQGRIGLVARGARGAKSKLRAVLQPFQPLLLSWIERGELGTLTGAETEGPVPALKGEAVLSGWYINELILRLLQRRDPHPALFEDYAAALAALPGPGPQAALRIFEKRLLTELGYGLNLPENLSPELWYAYDAESGVRPLAGAQVRAYRGASLLALRREQWSDPESLRDARRLLRAALEPHLGGRRLETPRLLRALKSELRAREAELGKYS